MNSSSLRTLAYLAMSTIFTAVILPLGLSLDSQILFINLIPVETCS